MAQVRWIRVALQAMIVAACGCAPAFAADHTRLAVEAGKTSIYIGQVTISMTPFRHETGVYAAEYRAKVFPYFFANENGWLKVDFNDDQLTRLDRGERVSFSGTAENTAHEPRRIEGFATPDSPGAKQGKIKVRVFVTKKTELIFNTRYRFD